MGVMTVVILAVGLCGCTGGPSPAPAKTHTARLRVTPTQSATADRDAGPKPRIPLPCGKLIGPAIVQSFLPKSTLNTTPDLSPLGTVLQQAGVIQCNWDTAEISGGPKSEISL